MCKYKGLHLHLQSEENKCGTKTSREKINGFWKWGEIILNRISCVFLIVIQSDNGLYKYNPSYHNLKGTQVTTQLNTIILQLTQVKRQLDPSTFFWNIYARTNIFQKYENININGRRYHQDYTFKEKEKNGIVVGNFHFKIQNQGIWYSYEWLHINNSRWYR